jgi:hypothetical protein
MIDLASGICSYSVVEYAGQDLNLKWLCAHCESPFVIVR